MLRGATGPPVLTALTWGGPISRAPSEERALDVTLKMIDPGLSDERLQEITEELAAEISRETELQPTLPPVAESLGAKGDPVSLGTLVLTLLSSGTAVALVHVLRAYLQRSSTLRVRLTRGSDGEHVEFEASDMRGGEISRALELIESLTGEGR